MTRFTVVIAARNEEMLLPATLAGVRESAYVGAVVVADDGSRDDTASVARAAGAHVCTIARSRGKTAAMMAGVRFAMDRELTDPGGLLVLDADVGESVRGIDPVLRAVADDELDLAIAVYTARGAAGGHGLVVGLARRAIAASTGWQPTVPLSGVRAMTWAAYASVTPFAPGWGVETAMTIDAMRAGLRVGEVDTTLTHRATGANLRAQMHRGRQYVDVWRAVRRRRARGR